MKIKKKRKKRKWDWLLELFDLIEVIAQIIGWLVRGIFHFIAKILK